MGTGAIDDGDTVKGLGFVTMYSAWVEEDIDEVLRRLSPLEAFTAEVQRLPISKKLKHAKKLVERLGCEDLKELTTAIEDGERLFQERNEFVHGRIFSSHDGDVLKPGRPNETIRTISSKEVYSLANKFHALRSRLRHTAFSPLAQAVDAHKPLKPGPINARPTHPGKTLRDDFLPDFELTTNKLASALGVSQQSVNELLREKRAVSTEMALRLGKLFGKSPKFWLDAQRAVDLWDAAKAIKSQVNRIKPLKVA